MASVKKGRFRLTLLLCGGSGLTCALLMIGVIVFYGTPYNPFWWWVMAGIQVAAIAAPGALVPAIEWVMEGYRQQANE